MPRSRPTVPPALEVAPVVELRRYVLHAGRRDDLIDLFETHLIEPQEAAGIRVAGLFRDLDNDDMFVWLRGFANMQQRRDALATFYGGPVWREHRNAANETMLDSDDVLLLRPTEPARPVPAPEKARREPQVGEPPPIERVWMVVLHHEPSESASHWLATDAMDALTSALGGRRVGAWRTLRAQNTYPQLPIREQANVFVGCVTFEDDEQFQIGQVGLENDPNWNGSVLPELSRAVTEKHELRLAPTSRSQHPAAHSEMRR